MRMVSPGRTRPSNQAVMSAITASESSVKTSTSANIRRRLFAFGYHFLLVVHWSELKLSAFDVSKIVMREFDSDSMPALRGYISNHVSRTRPRF
jgi:hypothetical protein